MQQKNNKCFSCTFQTSPNIALIKYWGKFNEQYILPLNDSVGITLDSRDLKTTTKVSFSLNIKKDILILNEKQHLITKRIQKMLDKVRIKAKHIISSFGLDLACFQIISNNSFPTASGMASSASGLACLALCLNKLFGQIFQRNQVSELARLGSGSASRSIYGGLVKWNGVDKSILNTIPTQQNLQNLSKKWFEKLSSFSILILLSNPDKKQVSSTEGMKRSVQTSELIQFRNQICKNRIKSLIQSLQQNDINTFSQIIIRDSNQFHSICLDTYPPIFYLDEFSKQVMRLVDQQLNVRLKTKIAYTFDAGPHAFLIIHNSVLQEISQLNERAQDYYQSFNQNIGKIIEPKFRILQRPKNIWLTTVGSGPLQIQ